MTGLVPVDANTGLPVVQGTASGASGCRGDGQGATCATAIGVKASCTATDPTPATPTLPVVFERTLATGGFVVDVSTTCSVVVASGG